MRKLIKKSLKKALWPVLPKPWETEDMEFHFGLWNGVSALYSESGRQLGEENARPFSLNHHISADTIECKYNGSRMGRAINMSALRIAMQNFDAAAAITLAVRRYHLARLPRSHILGIWDLHIIAKASIAMIAYQQRYARQTVSKRAVGDALTSQYQFISGVFMICRHMMENGDPAIVTNSSITADELYSYADKHGIFVSFNGMACAGSTKKIVEFLELCNSGTATKDSVPLALDQIVSQPDNWYQYALAAIELDCLIDQERAARQSAWSASIEQSPDQAAKIAAILGRYVRELMDQAPQNDHASFEIAALSRQNRILELLERSAIKKIPKAHFASRIG